MSMETHSSLWSVPSKEGAELGITKHLSDDRLEVYIPKEAEVQSVRAQTLPPGMRKKMGLLSTARASDADHVTWISPVVVRERPLPSSALRPTQSPAPESLSPSLPHRGLQGRKLLPQWVEPVLAACGVFQPPCFQGAEEVYAQWEQPDSEPQAGNPPTRLCFTGRPLRFSQDAIIIRQSQIFLSVKKSGPGRKRVEPSQTSLRESPSSLLQQGGVGVPRCPKDSQHSLDPSAVPPLKASQCPVSLRALCLQFGVERRACVTVAGLPDEVLKTLSAVGFVDLKNEPTATRLFCKDGHRKLESFGHGYSDGSSRNCFAQDLTASRRSRDGMMGGAFHKDNIMGGKGTREPVSKKARRASCAVGTDEVKGGDVDAIGVNGGDLCTDEKDSTKISILKVDGGELLTDEPQVVHVGTTGVKNGDLCTDEVQDGDLGTFGVKDGDLCTNEVEDGDLGTFGLKDGDLCTDEVKDGDVGTFRVDGGDVHTDEVEDGDLSSLGVDGGDVHADGVEDGDCTSCKAEDEGHYTVDRDDLGARAVLGGDGSAGEDISPGGTLEPEEAYLPVPCLEYAAGFDFDQSARDERINRIRARLREKQAALLMLKLSPF